MVENLINIGNVMPFNRFICYLFQPIINVLFFKREKLKPHYFNYSFHKSGWMENIRFKPVFSQSSLSNVSIGTAVSINFLKMAVFKNIWPLICIDSFLFCQTEHNLTWNVSSGVHGGFFYYLLFCGLKWNTNNFVF